MLQRLQSVNKFFLERNHLNIGLLCFLISLFFMGYSLLQEGHLACSILEFTSCSPDEPHRWIVAKYVIIMSRVGFLSAFALVVGVVRVNIKNCLQFYRNCDLMSIFFSFSFQLARQVASITVDLYLFNAVCNIVLR